MQPSTTPRGGLSAISTRRKGDTMNFKDRLDAGRRLATALAGIEINDR